MRVECQSGKLLRCGRPKSATDADRRYCEPMISIRYDRGLALPDHGLWLDPWEAKPLAFGERIGATTSRRRKIALLAEYLRSLAPEALPIAAVDRTGGHLRRPSRGRCKRAVFPELARAARALERRPRPAFDQRGEGAPAPCATHCRSV